MVRRTKWKVRTFKDGRKIDYLVPADPDSWGSEALGRVYLQGNWWGEIKSGGFVVSKRVFLSRKEAQKWVQENA